ncbi:MAG: PHP domain-containing protein [Chloroflexi bacterium]|nr:PHP domain-containing protein [Chloroflexota bacterium]
MLIDIHTHTWPLSSDSLLTPEELIARAKASGLDGICLTDHDQFWDKNALAALTAKYDFLVLPGVELTTEEGHLLVFGLEKYVFGMHKASFVREVVDAVGGAIVVAHPYRKELAETDSASPEGFRQAMSRACASPIYQMAEAVEVLNGRGSAKENAFSLEVCQNLKKKGTASSDAHAPSDLGICATYFERKIQSLQELIQELKAGRFYPFDLRSKIPSL